jgi:hypothetical protein
MSKSFILPVLTLAAVLGGGVRVHSQVTVVANPNQEWIGFMNVFSLAGSPASYSAGNYEFGSVWGTADLRANPDPAGGTNYVVLTPCTNVWNPTDSYWVINGSPNQWMDANYYLQDDTLAGQDIIFQGSCLSNTLSGGAYSQAFIKDYSPDYSTLNNELTVPLVAGQPFAVSLQTIPGDHIQYGFETEGPDVNPLYNTSYVVVAYDNTNISLLPIPGASLVEGQTATFAVTNLGSPATSYQWAYSPDSYTYYPLSDGVQASGSTVQGSAASTLMISNVMLGDIGYYTVTVANSAGSAQETTTLAVQLQSDQLGTNMLADPGFESGSFAPISTAGWFPFNGADIENTNDYFYYLTDIPIVALDGTDVCHVYDGGGYNGVYQDRPAAPGTVYTGNAWFLTPSEDPITGAGACYLEVQFLDTHGGVLKDYRSASVTTNSPLDTWINLTPTNMYSGDFTTFLGTSPYMVAPPGSATARFQITYVADTGGSIYVDETDLRLRAPVPTLSVSGNKVRISFPTLYGPVYQVLYKTNMTDASWTTNATTITGDGTVKTLVDPITPNSRFYIVNTQ